MSIGTALAKANDIKRRVLKGKRTSLFLYDQTNQIVIGKIKSWNVERLTVLQPESPDFKFIIRQDTTTATPANLNKYDLVYNEYLYDVLDRNEPLGEKEILWVLLGRSMGKKITVP